MTNYVVLYIGGEPWTLAGVCIVGAAVLAMAWLVLLFLYAPRWGTVRRLSSHEAARVGSSATNSAMQIAGPGAAREWRININATNLREAWHAQDYFKFFAMPLFNLLWPLAFEVMCFSGYLAAGPESWVVFLLVPNLVLAPIILVTFFVMWAAVFTNLK